MSRFDIHAVFVWPGSYDGPEMACAWDAYCVDSNPEGWAKEQADRIAAYGDELDPSNVRRVEITLNAEQIEGLFHPASMPGVVRGTTETKGASE